MSLDPGAQFFQPCILHYFKIQDFPEQPESGQSKDEQLVLEEIQYRSNLDLVTRYNHLDELESAQKENKLVLVTRDSKGKYDLFFCENPDMQVLARMAACINKKNVVLKIKTNKIDIPLEKEMFECSIDGKQAVDDMVAEIVKTVKANVEKLRAKKALEAAEAKSSVDAIKANNNEKKKKKSCTIL